MSGLSLAGRYAVFAATATLANLAVQGAFLRIYRDAGSLYVAMMAGTLIGLVVKYLLDKRFIFHFRTRSRSEDLGRFFLYSLMGVFTTGIFWGTELLFDRAFSADWAPFAGAALGLAGGYTVKYYLDRRFVFQKRPGR